MKISHRMWLKPTFNYKLFVFKKIIFKIDQILREIAINCQTSMPDEIKLISALGTAYAVFPSKESAKKILYVIFS